MCNRFLPRVDLTFKYFPVNLEQLQPLYRPANPVPVIVHAPNHRNLKGTEFLLRAAERLQSRGVAFKLQLVERVAHDEATQIYRQADIIADQFRGGTYGVFALEGMALGKPVLSYLDQESLTADDWDWSATEI